ncbi:MAG: hypothetical protein AB1500_02910 [Bacillota bacterium]
MAIKEDQASRHTAAKGMETLFGLPFRLPDYLPRGYELTTMSGDEPSTTVNGKTVGSFKTVEALCEAAGNRMLHLFVSDNKQFLKAGKVLRQVKVAGKDAGWAEYSVVSFNGGGREDNGIAYIVSNDSGELTLNEMLRVAGSIY